MSETLWPSRWAWLLTGAALALPTSALMAQGAPPPAPAHTSAPAPAPPAPSPPPALVKTVERIPEGTEVKVRLEEKLSSASAAVGDTFTISTDEEIHLADGTIIPAGFRGKGEVTAVEKKGMLGKAGELSIRLNDIRIGDVRVHLRANKGGEGKSGVTSTVVLSLLVSPLFLMHHGHDLVFPKGQLITAYVDDAADVPLPIPQPPKDD